MEQIKKENGRNFCLLLYPEDITHASALDKLKSNYDYAYILHDKDFYLEDEYDKEGNLKHAKGEIKKPHWHVVINVGPNARWNTAIASELGITPNYVEKCGKLDRALEYLIHFNEPDKYHYELDEVHGNLKTRLKIEINKQDKTEGEKVVELLDYIDGFEGYLKVKDFSRFCATNGYWDVFRRSGAIFIKMIDEHNRLHAMAMNNLDKFDECPF